MLSILTRLSSLFSALLLIFALTSCEQSEHHSEHAHQEHGDHSQAADANEYMHQSDFERLVKHFEDPARDEWQKPELVIDQMGDLSGKTVADIGAGTGYFTFRLAGKAEKVIAIDIDQRFLDYIKEKNDSLNLPVETRKVPEDDPNLAPGEADIVLTVNTYHHIENRPAYFGKVRENLPPGGFLMVVDFKKQEMPVGPPLRMKLTEEQLVEELREAGFENFNIDSESLKYQYIVVAK